MMIYLIQQPSGFFDQKRKTPFSTLILTVVFSTLIICFSSAEGQVNDAGLWIDVTLKKKITKRLDVSLTEEIRLNENITEAGTIYTEAGVEYEVVNGLKTGVFYRFISKRRMDDSYSKCHRYYFDVSYGLNIKRVEIKYRFRFQQQYKDYNSRPEGHVPVNYIRQKLGLSVTTRTRFNPYLDGEIWYHLNSPWSQFDGVRFSTGIVTRITRHHFIDTGYIYQKEFNVNDPVTDYIMFIGYKFVF